MQCQPSGCMLAVALVFLFSSASSISCPTPVHPQNGRAEWQGLSPGDKVNYSCNFVRSGPSVATCQSNGRWSSRPPTCFIQGCPLLPPVPNSLHRIGQQGGFMYVFYHCFTGYRLVGHVYLTCFGSAGWSHHPPVCMEAPQLECSDPVAPANGGRTYRYLSVGSSVQYHCQPGHRLVGERVRTCLNQEGKAEWSGPPPVCEAMLCPMLKRPTNGGLLVATLEVGSRAIYSCNEGYKMVKGSASRTCEEKEVEEGQKQAVWSGSDPRCAKVQCPEPLSTGNGRYAISSRRVGGRARFQCNRNYTLQGSGLLHCKLTRSGTAVWSGALPFCKLLECSVPDKPLHGDYSVESFSVGSSVGYHCSDGFYLDGDQERVCQEEATNNRAAWSGAVPQCLRLTCPDPGKPTHGGHLISSSHLGGRVTFYCDGGYQLVGDEVLVCEQMQVTEAAWNGSVPTCEPIMCDDPGTPINGSRTLTSAQLGGSVRFHCSTGYQLVGEEALFCQQDGHGRAVWSGRVPTCESIQVFFQPVTYTVAEGDNATVFLAVSSGNYGHSITVNLAYVDLSANRDADYIPSSTSVVFNHGQATATLQIHTLASHEVQELSEVFAVTILGVSPPLVVGDNNTARITITDTDVQTTGQNSECGEPVLIVNGGQTFIDTSEGTVVEYHCRDGYELVGSPQQRCLLSGEWSDPPPTCQPMRVVTCSFISSPVNGRVVYSDLSLRPGTTANFSCNYAHDMDGVSMLVCLETGQWDQLVPECKPANITTCPHVIYPPNGTVAYDTPRRAVESVATFGCESGFMLEGSAWSTCLSSGQWDRPAPTCAQVLSVTCPTLPSPTNGLVTYSQLVLEPTTIATFSCRQGYNLDGFGNLTCGDDGEWDHPMPTCRADLARCAQLRDVDNAVMSVVGNGGPGTVVSYVCDAGYKLDGAASIRCMQNGEWDSVVPTCTPVTCPFPGVIDNGVPSSSADAVFLVGSNVTYSCNSSSYELKGSAVLTCLPNGQWDQPNPMCLEITCPFPGVIENGSSTASRGARFSINATVNFTCTTGYELVGSASLQCQGSGEWSDTVPTCQIIDCGDPGTPENGRRTLLGTIFGSVVTFECEPGHRPEGLPFRVCQEDKQWSNSVPNCSLVDCGDPGNPQNGRRILQGGTTFQSNVTYECNTGFRLEGVALRTCRPLAVWSGSQPSCTLVTCTPLTAPSNGSVTLSGSSFGDTANFTCTTGYELVGSASLQCQGSGEWSDTVPTCQRQRDVTQVIDCGDPGNPQNGRRILQGGTTFQSNVTYECNTGFRLEGVSLRTCLPLAVWSGSQPSCTLVTCTPLTAPSNGNVTLSGSSFGDMANFTCTTGYELVGSASLQCQGSGEWSDTVPTCQIIDCGDPGTPENGRRTLLGTIFDSVVTYECEPGHQPEGLPFRVCQEDKQWSNSVPNCSLVDCGDPGNPQNGRRILQGGTTFQSNVTYECNTGFRLEGVALRTCRPLGIWSGSQPSCTLRDCGDPGTPQNGSRRLQGTKYQDTVRYQCDTGFKLSGAEVRACQESGTWTGSLPTCAAIDCGDPGVPANGDRSFSSTLFNTVVNYSCNEGYELFGSQQRTCQVNEQWSQSLPECRLVSCGDPGTPRNGLRTLSATTFNSTVTYDCSVGYTLEGPRTRQCLSNKSWSNSLPQCELIECPDPGIPENGRRQLSTITVGSQVVYDCDDGFTLSGERAQECLVNGTWSSQLPSCEPVDCGDPGLVENGEVNVTSTTYGSTATYTCATGYTLTGLAFRTCQFDGRWSGALPECRVVYCPDPSMPNNGFRNSTSTRFGSTVEYSCAMGFEMQGNSTRTCKADGTWSASIPICQLASCPDPGIPPNSQRQLTALTVGSYITYSCVPGYRLVGAPHILCLMSQEWSALPPRCALISCGDPGIPVNGFRLGDNFTFRSIVHFRCNDSYELSGNERRECRQDGRWSGFTPRCVIGGCGDPGTPENGRRDLTGTSVASTVSYQCQEGYRLRGSQFSVCQTSGIWSGRLPSCDLVNCGDPGVIRIGSRNFSSGTEFASVVTYTCPDGYQLTGSQTRTCQSNGRWSSTLPMCTPSGCGDPGDLDNGRVEFSNDFKIFSMATYFCSSGYRLRGMSVRMCLSGGQWSSRQPSCELIDCGDPGFLRNGNRNLSANTFGSSVEYTCRPGYRLVGSRLRTCGANGRWSSSLPSCDPVDCGDPGSVQMGVRELLEGTTFRSTTIFKCNRGYRLEGSATRTCQANGSWSGSLPRCVAILCDDPGTPPNGVRSLQTLTVNSIVAYQCNRGHNLEGTSSRVCRMDGQWTGQLPTCRVVNCGDPGLPANSDRDLIGGTTFNGVVRYTCREGYRLQGSTQRQCQANGQWSGSLPICIRSDCGDPGLVSSGQRELTGTAVGEMANFTCFEGFRMEGSAQRECQQSGLWSGTQPTCTLIDCGDPGIPANGQRSVTDSSFFSSEVSYTCNAGFVLIGPTTRVCNESGWSGFLPFCERVDCGDPGVIRNGDRALGSTTYLSRVVYFCVPGYVLDGNSNRVCEANGNWSGSLPTCIIVTCGDPGTPSNGQRQLSGQNFGTEVTYTCDEGYELEGSQRRTCEARGEWSGELPQCKIVDCGSPGVPQNGLVDVADTAFRSVATYSCDEGYELVGEASRVCGSDGEWSESIPSCRPVNCGDPGGIVNGDVFVLGTTLNSVARYSCRRGYLLVGVKVITCLAVGRWSSGLPRCDPIDCGDPGTPLNGKLQLSAGTKLNSVVRYSCSVGYVLMGATERICQAGGTWSASLPICEVVNCGDPGTPSHGMREPDPVATQLSNVVRYSCDVGYELLGSQERTCQSSGEWSGQLPTCQIVDCGDPGSPNDGVHRVFSTTFGSVAHYECDSRFRLVGMEQRICQPNGQWSGSLPSCVLIDCGTPEEPQNGLALLRNGTTLGARATYQCKVGFKLSSTVARICLAGEVWSGTVPSCTLVECGDPGTPLNGVKLGSRMDYLLTVVYSCNPGYAVIGGRTRTCQATGLWTGTLPVCKLVDCGDPGTLANGFRIGSNQNFGNEVSYRCDFGFQLSGSQTRSCQSNGRWSGTLPVCMIVTCGDPGTPSNGQRQLSDQNFGTEVTYTCDEGYELEGSQRRTCEARGEWSGELPQCKIVDCDDPGTPLNGKRQLNITTFGSIVEFSCNNGYELVGRQQRTCGSTGQWSGSVPVCTPTDCGDPGRPRNGDRVLSDTSFGSQVLYICNPGFEISGSHRRVCEASGTWSNSLPVCTAIECGDPGVPQNGSRQLSGRTAGSSVAYRCDSGFELVGAQTLRCMDSGEWSDRLPQCRVIDCRDPGRPQNGRRSLGRTTYQSTVTYSCDSGYLLVGEESQQCQANGKWSGVLAVCSPVDCQDPGTPANGDRMLVSTTFMSTVFYSCRLGYNLEGNQHRICQASGNWSGDLPICREIDCGEPGETNNGSVDVQGSGMGAVASYRCNRGYQLEGDSRRICQASETWTGTVPTCRIVDCFDPGVPANGLKQLPSTTFGSTVRYSCRQGHRLQGQSLRSCQPSGRWSGTLPQCVPSDCGDLGAPQDGQVDFSSTTIGSFASYSCSVGYTLVGTATRICQPNGEWSASAPDCALVDCGDPGTPANGVKLGFATTYQSVVNYACRTGFAMRGVSQRTCQASGEWTGSLPLCDLVDCGDPGNIKSGQKTGTNYKFGGKVSYICNNGFQLSGSQTRSCQASGSWSGSTPECVEVTCGDPGTPVNGQRVLEDTTFDATVTYSCNEGYVLVGEKERQCGSDGQWSGPLPRCDLVSCGDPGQVLNALRTTSSFTFGSKVQFQCRVGYQLEGRRELVCLSNRLWSHPLPRCSLVDCGDPGRSSNGQRSLVATTVFSIATYSCNRGYNLLGNRVRTCLPSGSWNGTIPDCRVVDCGSPASPANGTIQQLTGTRYGHTVSYTCNIGYSLVGAATRVCQDDGQWSEDVPVCKIIDCRDPGTPRNGRRQLSATTFAATVTYFCSEGYSIKGSEMRACQNNGRWSNFLPVCEPINCGDPGSPVNAIRLLSATTLNSEVQFQCVEGHVMEGDAVRTCQADGRWTGTLPRCVPITCRDPGTPVNGQRTLQSLTVGAVVSYHCQEGYSIVGGPTRTCQSSGEWTRGLPLCLLLDCGDPGTLANGLREMNGTTFQSAVTYSCNAGYVIKGDSLRRCLSNGFWSGSLPLCQPVDCGIPGMPHNGYGVYNLTILDAMVTYGCNRGYSLVGNTKRTCINSGSWSGSIPECRVVDCGNAGSPANGRVSFASTILRSTAVYSCNSGYSLRGVSRRVCQESGTWSGSLPACQLVECGDPGQLENGVRSLVGVTFGSAVSFSCNTDFTLSGPDRRVCQADGSWSEFQPVCKRIRCTDPGTPSDGTRQLLDTVVGSMVTYSCHKGYNLSGDAERTCQADTTWTGSLPVCRIVDCGDPGTPTFGSHDALLRTTYEATVSYFCQPGYLLRGGPERLCLDNGQWSGYLPTCIAIDCGIPGIPDNGGNSYNATTYSSTARYTCNVNFELVGTDLRQCQLDGTWSGAVPVCRRIPDVDCGDPGRPANGDSSFSSTVEGASVLHSCQPGYSLVGDRRRVCRGDGRWSGSLPECRGIDCGAPDQVVNGNIDFTTTSLGSVATYTCNPGDILQGNPRRTCEQNGQWSGSPPTCTPPPTAPPPNHCPDPGVPDNAGRSTVGLNVGDTVSYACLPGFRLVGDATLTCLSNGQWSISPPLCEEVILTATPTTPETSTPPSATPPSSTQPSSTPPSSSPSSATPPSSTPPSSTPLSSTPPSATPSSSTPPSSTPPSSTPPSLTPPSTPPPLRQCGVPESPSNGQVSYSSQEVGSFASYVCNEGFSLDGEPTRQCKNNSQWSGSVPICTPIGPALCHDPGAPQNGQRIVITTDSNVTLVYYACFDGFELVDGSSRRTCQPSGSFDGHQPRCTPISRVCQGSGIRVDQCGRKCTCINGTLSACSRVRLDFLSLTPEEKQRYLDTVKRVSTDAFYKPRYEYIIKKFEDFSDTNAFANNPAVSQFFPWLRFYLIEYENLLKSVDCRVTVPFWDWTTAPTMPFNTSYFSNDLGFGNTIDSSTQCVTTGPFRESVWQVTPSAGGECLRRELDTTKSYPDADLIADVLIQPATDFAIFFNLLKFLVYDPVRCFVGGQMCSTDAPNDPAFLLLAARIDAIFDQWQKGGDGRESARYGTDNTTLVGTELPVSAYSNNLQLPHGVAVEYGLPFHLRRQRSAQRRLRFPQRVATTPCLSEQVVSKLGSIPEETLIWLRNLCLPQ